MKTYVDCLPCILRMIFDAIKLATKDEDLQKKIYYRMLKDLEGEGTEKSPPEIFGNLYKIIKEMSGNADPYSEIKKKCNDLILAIESELSLKLEKMEDPLLAAIELSIAGNIIDYGINGQLDVEKEIDKILIKENKRIAKESDKLFAFNKFRKSLEKANNLLFISDNAGEIVLDKLLLERIRKFKPSIQITLATRSFPVLNDITKTEAIYCGLDKVVDEIIETASYFPGTVLTKSDPNFLLKMQSADLIISKGQGNFETMFKEQILADLAKEVSQEKFEMYFLFMAKCEVIVGEVNRFFTGCKLNDILLLENE